MLERRGDVPIAMRGLKPSQVGSLLKLVDDRAWESLHLVTGARTRHIRRPNTALYHSQSIFRIINTWPELVTMDVVDVTEDALAEWQARFSKRYAPDTVNGALVIMRAVFRTAVRRRLIENDPTTDLQRLEIPNIPWVVPTTEQWNRAVEALKRRAARRDKITTTHQMLLVLWLAATGMRPRAAVALLISDVDFKNATARLDGEHAKNRRNAILPIGASALDAARLAAGDRPGTERLFLCVSARYALELASTAAGVRINHRTLRKLFATRALEAGIAPAIAARLLTHQDGGQTLLKHYAVWRDEALRAAVKRMDDVPET